MLERDKLIYQKIKSTVSGFGRKEERDKEKEKVRKIWV